MTVVEVVVAGAMVVVVLVDVAEGVVVAGA